MLAGPALAGDLTYSSPKQGDAFYSPTSMMVGDISGGLGWLDSGSNSTGFAVLGARLNLPLHDGWNLEPDLGLATAFDPSVTVAGGVAHLYKNLPNADVGVFLGGYGTSAPSTSTGTFILGAEAAYYGHPNSIFGARAAYAWVSNSTSYPILGANWDYFFTPDVKSTLRVDWMGGTSGQPDATTGALALTKRWFGTAWSGYVQGSVTSVGSRTAYSGLVGVTWNHDNGMHQYDHDRALPFKFATSLY